MSSSDKYADIKTTSSEGQEEVLEDNITVTNDDIPVLDDDADETTIFVGDLPPEWTASDLSGNFLRFSNLSP
jgi:hypothetical protein